MPIKKQVVICVTALLLLSVCVYGGRYRTSLADLIGEYDGEGITAPATRTSNYNFGYTFSQGDDLKMRLEGEFDSGVVSITSGSLPPPGLELATAGFYSVVNSDHFFAFHSGAGAFDSTDPTGALSPDEITVLMTGSGSGYVDFDWMGWDIGMDVEVVEYPWGRVDQANIIIEGVADVLMGNINNSGYIDDDDLAILLAYWGTGIYWDQGNFNDDYIVDDDDLAMLLAPFDPWPGPDLPPSDIPEPATALLVAVGACASILSRRRR